MAVNVREVGDLNRLEGFLKREEASIEHFKIAYVAVGQAGGRIASNFSRLGYYGVYINTCEQDLIDVENALLHFDRGMEKNYKIIRLLGYDGASKDRYVGLQAVKDNKELIQKELICDQNLADADFVFVIGSNGGGTGCGAMPTIAQLVSGVIRKNKRVMLKKDRQGNVIDIGKATVGMIVAVPDDNAGPKMKLNSAEAIEEIKVLQDKKIIGAVLYVDNEKLISDYLKQGKTNTNWMSYGNATIASVIGEIAILTSIPGEETLDKSELLDILSTPASLFIGKNRLYGRWQDNYRPIKELSSEEEKIETIVDESFKSLGVFAEGYDFKNAIHGGMAIVANENKTITSRHKLLLQRALNKTLDGPEVIHFGVFNNTMFGTYEELKTDRDEAIIYTLAVIKGLPKRIYDMTEAALEAKKKSLEKSSQEVASLKEFLNQGNSLANNSVTGLDLDMDSILNGDLFGEAAPSKSIKAANDIEDEFNKLFSV